MSEIKFFFFLSLPSLASKLTDCGKEIDIQRAPSLASKLTDCGKEIDIQRARKREEAKAIFSE